VISARRVLLFSLILFVSIPAWTQPLSVSGSVFRAGQNATPWPGLRVYIHGAQGNWIGPSITDGYGRYAFSGLTYQKQYLLRVYDGGQLKWQQELSGPENVPPIILP